MKVLKTAIMGALALSAASLADAQTVVHITGSTAFRNATVIGITNILQAGFTYAYAGTSFTGANQQIFTGTTIVSNIPVIIKTSWTGAVAGVQTVSQQFPIATWLTNTTPQSTTGSANAPANYDPPAVPEVCMDDGVQANTPFPTPILTATNVGAVTFKWIASPGSPAAMTNLTPFMAQALWENGSLPLASFTGVAADETKHIFSIGRDPDSGTRKCALSENGVGPFNTVVQWAPTNSSGGIISRTIAGPLAGQVAWPAETVDGIFFDVGDGGYSSGGDLAVGVSSTNTLAIIGGYYLTYLGLSDSTTALNNNCVALSWNGVPYSDTAIQEGQYTFLGFEQLCYRANYGSVDANGKEVADLLAKRIHDVDAINAGELMSSMRCTRSVEGGLVTPIY